MMCTLPLILTTLVSAPFEAAQDLTRACSTELIVLRLPCFSWPPEMAGVKSAWYSRECLMGHSTDKDLCGNSGFSLANSQLGQAEKSWQMTAEQPDSAVCPSWGSCCWAGGLSAFSSYKLNQG